MICSLDKNLIVKYCQQNTFDLTLTIKIYCKAIMMTLVDQCNVKKIQIFRTISLQ